MKWLYSIANSTAKAFFCVRQSPKLETYMFHDCDESADEHEKEKSKRGDNCAAHINVDAHR